MRAFPKTASAPGVTFAVMTLANLIARSTAQRTLARTGLSLNAWRVPRVRNEHTGDLSHPPIIYIIGPDGRIGYVVQGNASAIVAAVRAL